MEYTAHVTREDDWWIIRVPELGQTTQARSVDDVPLMARECIASLLEVDTDDVAVDLVFEGPR